MTGRGSEHYSWITLPKLHFAVNWKPPEKSPLGQISTVAVDWQPAEKIGAK